MKEMLIILLSAVLIENFVLTKFLGICPFLGVSKKLGSALGMSGAVLIVMTAATALTWPVYTYLLEPYNLGYLITIAFILIIALFVQIVEILLEKFIPALHKSLGVYLPLIVTNCAVLGVTLLNIDNGYNFIQSIFNAIGGGLGFSLALLVFSFLRQRLEESNIPKAFKGLPSTLIAASIFSLSFAGFNGIIEGMFG